MEITIIDDCQANLELSDLEIVVIRNIYKQVKNALNHEHIFQSRVGISYSEAQQLISSLNNNFIVDSKEVAFIKNILNEICHEIIVEDFDTQIGITKVETKSYLRAFNQLMNKLHD
jgi:hypothetical protein